MPKDTIRRDIPSETRRKFLLRRVQGNRRSICSGRHTPSPGLYGGETSRKELGAMKKRDKENAAIMKRMNERLTTTEATRKATAEKRKKK
jgi:hypothetical protein